MFKSKMKLVDHVEYCLSKTRLDDVKGIFSCVNEDAKGKTFTFNTDWSKSDYDNCNVEPCYGEEDVSEIRDYKTITETYNEEGLKVEASSKCKSKWKPEEYSYDEITKYSYDNKNRLTEIVTHKKHNKNSIISKIVAVTYEADEIKINIEGRNSDYEDEERKFLIREYTDIAYYTINTAKSGNTEVIRMNLNNRPYLTQYIVDGKITRLVDHRCGETHYFTQS